MTFKSCNKMNEIFKLDDKFEPFFESESGKKVSLTKPLEKGYVYASLFFYDEAMREIEKLGLMVNKIRNELAQEVHIEDPTKLFMELSSRVRSAIGDDSLDALIKEKLAGDFRVMALLPTEGELSKLMGVQDAIFKELFQNFVDMTFKNTQDVGAVKSFRFSQDYVNALTERQKKLLSPALRMAGFINKLRLDEFEILSDWSVQYKPVPLNEGFESKEAEIKLSLKKLLEENM